jgi:hypothetical protein
MWSITCGLICSHSNFFMCSFSFVEQSYLSAASLFSSTICSIRNGGTKTDCASIIRESSWGVIVVGTL